MILRYFRTLLVALAALPMSWASPAGDDMRGQVVAEFGGVDRARALELLHEAGGSAKVAILMAARDLDAPAARRELDAVQGVLDRTLPDPKS